MVVIVAVSYARVEKVKQTLSEWTAMCWTFVRIHTVCLHIFTPYCSLDSRRETSMYCKHVKQKLPFSLLLITSQGPDGPLRVIPHMLLYYHISSLQHSSLCYCSLTVIHRMYMIWTNIKGIRFFLIYSKFRFAFYPTLISGSLIGWVAFLEYWYALLLWHLYC